MPVPDKDTVSELVLGVRAVLRSPELLRGLSRREKRAELADRLLPSKSSRAGWPRRRAPDESTIAPDSAPDAVGLGMVGTERQNDHARIASNTGQNEDQLGTPVRFQLTPEHQREIRRLKKELLRKKKIHALLAREFYIARRQGNASELRERVRQIKSIKQDVFSLRNETDVVRREAGGEPGMGALPDFAIIGARQSAGLPFSITSWPNTLS